MPEKISSLHRLRPYSQEMLRYALGPQSASPSAAAAGDAQAGTMLKAWRQSRRPHLLLLGLGQGLLAERLADEVAARGGSLVVCGFSPENARRRLAEGRLHWWREDGAHHLLVDTSIWAHFLLLAGCGLCPDNARAFLNPESTGGEHGKHAKSLQHLFMSATRAALPGSPATPRAEPTLSVAAILRPDEPRLERFISQIPDWVREIVLVWDGAMPADAPQAAVPVRSLVSSLANDFSAQRNRMLAACSSDFVLYLDADELLEPRTWEALPRLMAHDEAAWFFPRHTFFPDERHVRIGFGLWPDLQLRLFRRHGNIRFVRPVHERLTGISGPCGLLLDHPILHGSHLCKSNKELESKLDLFSQASRGAIRHRLNGTYPHLDASLLAPSDDMAATYIRLGETPSG